MSWWINRGTRGDDRRIVLIDFPWISLLTVAGILVALLFPMIARYPLAAARGAVVAMLLGHACLVAAKVPQFRRGLWISWGTREMPPKFREAGSTGRAMA